MAPGTSVILTVHGWSVDTKQFRGREQQQGLHTVTILSHLAASQSAITFFNSHFYKITES